MPIKLELKRKIYKPATSDDEFMPLSIQNKLIIMLLDVSMQEIHPVAYIHCLFLSPPPPLEEINRITNT